VSRKRTGRKRGRPCKANARRNETTRRGRAGNPFIDRGTDQLRLRKLAIAGREDVDVTDAIAVLLARGIISAEEAIVLRTIEITLNTMRPARFGKSDLSVGGLWAALQSGQRLRAWAIPVSNGRRTPADAAWARLCRLHNHFLVAGQLDQLDAIMNIVEGRAGDLIARIARPRKTIDQARELAAEISELHDALALAGAIVQQGSRRRAMAGRRMARG
jgi:hypothetical protein